MDPDNYSLSSTASSFSQGKALLQAAKRSNYDMVNKLLKKDPDLSATDENGKSALHHAVINNNLHLVKLLLRYRASVNIADLLGRTPLHYAVIKESLQILKPLLFEDPIIDWPDNGTRKTPLHYAVEKGDINATTLLLFHGADLSLKNKQRFTAVDMCRKRDLRMILVKSRLLSDGVRLGGVTIQSKHVKEGSTTHFNNIGLKVKYNNEGLHDKFPLTIRRQKDEFSNVSIKLDDLEDSMSDIFVCCLGQTRDSTYVKLTIPIFATLQTTQDNILKTNKGHEIPVQKCSLSDDQVWQGVVHVDLSQFEEFVLISRPKREIFELNNVDEASNIKSTVDERVELDIPPNTFDIPTKIQMEILDTPTSCTDVEELDEMGTTTSFYTLNVDGSGGFSGQISMKLPIPEKFSDNGNIVIFSRDNFEEGDLESESDSDDEDECETSDNEVIEEEAKDASDNTTDNDVRSSEIKNLNKKWNKWHILDAGVNNEAGRLCFSLSSFSIKVAMDIKNQKKYLSKWNILKRHIQTVYKKSRQRERSVVFLVMPKALDDGNSYTVVVECTQRETAAERLEHWINEGFENQEPSYTAEYSAVARQKFVVGVSDNLRTLCSLPEQEIQFHPKRHNFQYLAVALRDVTDNRIGVITIGNKPKPLTTENKLRISIGANKKNTCNNILTTVVVTFPPPKLKEDYEECTSDSDFGDDDDEEFEGFTDDSFLSNITKELKEEWLKIAMLTGTHYRRLQNVMEDESRDDEEKKAYLIRRWRNRNKCRPHLGMPIMLSAISKVGRPDLNIMIKVMLKGLCCGEAEGTFYKWLQSAFKDPEIMAPDDYPRPMTESFLIQLIDFSECRYELVSHLGITDEEIEEVKQDEMCPTPAEKMLKLLVMGRRKSKNRILSFEKLIDGLTDMNIVAAKNWAIMAARRWSDKNKHKDDNFTQMLHFFLREI